LHIAEDVSDFSGWNFVGLMPIEDKPKLMIAVIHRMVGERMELCSVVISEEIFRKLNWLRFNLGEEIII
jgi:hypothetical protein